MAMAKAYTDLDIDLGVPESQEDLGKRYMECKNRNEKITKKIRNGQTRIVFKRDLEAKRMKTLIDEAVKKLTKMQETGQKEIYDMAEQRQTMLRQMQTRCSQRQRALVELINDPSVGRDVLIAALSLINDELTEAENFLETSADFELVIANELAELFPKLLQENCPVSVRPSPIIHPSQVELVQMASEPCSTDRTTITVVAAPPKGFHFHSLNVLAGTLQNVFPKSHAPLVINGVVSSLPEHDGSVKISFYQVPWGDYLIKVTMQNEDIRKSPMFVSLEAPKKEPTSTIKRSASQLSLERLANRARNRSESWSQSKGNAGGTGIGVAPKGLIKK